MSIDYIFNKIKMFTSLVCLFVFIKGDWFTETHLDAEKGQLTVVAGVKTEGEYALSITARTRDSADAPNTVLNYLLTTEENEDDGTKKLCCIARNNPSEYSENKKKLRKYLS